MIKRFALWFFLLAPLTAHAGEILIAGKTLKLTGSIEPSDVSLFQSIAGALDGRFTVDIATASGDPEAAMGIGRHVRKLGYGTRTSLENCLDVCALIWQAGTPRTKSDATKVALNETLFQANGPADRGRVEAYLRSLGLDDQETLDLLPRLPVAVEDTEENTGPSGSDAHEQDASYLAGYAGETRDGVPHGKGSWTFANGDRFRGTFQDGTPHGNGVIETAEGDRIDVVFERGQVTGNVRLAGAGGVHARHSVDGRLLEIRHDMAPWSVPMPLSSAEAKDKSRSVEKTGREVLLKDGSRYAGSLKNGQPHGFGTRTYRDGSAFTGMFENGNRHGPGILVTAQGMQSAGLWRNDEFRDGGNAGRAVKTAFARQRPNADTDLPSASMVPMDQLVGGMRRGDLQRLQMRLNTLSYDAGAADGKIGKRTRAAIDAFARDHDLAGGNRYHADLIAWIGGEVPETQPGWRTIEEKDCQVYSQVVHAITDINWSGVCLDGYAHGRGILTISLRLKGEPVRYVYEGVVKRGRLSGSGKDHWEGPHPADGARYEGTFENGVRTGAGTYSEPGLGRIEGSFEAGKPHGYAVQFDSDGNLVVSGEFNAGCLTSGATKLAVLTTRQACGF